MKTETSTCFHSLSQGLLALGIAAMALVGCQDSLSEIQPEDEALPALTQTVKSQTEALLRPRKASQGRDLQRNFKELAIEWGQATDVTHYYYTSSLEAPVVSDDHTALQLGDVELPYSKTLLVAFQGLNNEYHMLFRRLWSRTSEQLEDLSVEKFHESFTGVAKYYRLDGTYEFGVVFEHGEVLAHFQADGTLKEPLKQRPGLQAKGESCTHITTTYYVDVVTPYGTLTKVDYTEVTTVCDFAVDPGFGLPDIPSPGGAGSPRGDSTQALDNPVELSKAFDDRRVFPQFDWKTLNASQRAAILMQYLRWCKINGIENVDVTQLFTNLPSESKENQLVRFNLGGETFTGKITMPVAAPGNYFYYNFFGYDSEQGPDGQFWVEWIFRAAGDAYDQTAFKMSVPLRHSVKFLEFFNGSN